MYVNLHTHTYLHIYIHTHIHKPSFIKAHQAQLQRFTELLGMRVKYLYIALMNLHILLSRKIHSGTKYALLQLSVSPNLYHSLFFVNNANLIVLLSFSETYPSKYTYNADKTSHRQKKIPFKMKSNCLHLYADVVECSKF